MLRVSSVLLFFLVSQLVYGQECNRVPRSVYIQKDVPVDIYVSSQQRASVIFPEPDGVFGGEPEFKQGLKASIGRQPNKVFLHVDNDDYSGLFHVDGNSGDTYHLNLIARKGCADSVVSLEYQPLENKSLSKSSGKKKKGLMWYLLKGQLPSGYNKNSFSKLPKEERVVFEQGSIRLYLHEQWEGQKYIGSIYEVVNTGRLSVRFAIEQINYAHGQVVESIGKAREVAMLPGNLRLGPSPEFIEEIYSQSHRGMVFIVSEKPGNKNG